MNAASLSADDAWVLFRRLFAVAALATWLPRAQHLAQNYSSEGIVVMSGPMAWTRWVVFSPLTAWILWTGVIAALAGIGLGFRPKALAGAFLFCALALLGAEGMNMKAYDRLLCWQAFSLFFTPARGQAQAGSLGRLTLLVIYGGLYGSTGWLKILEGRAWWTGQALAYSWVDLHFGMLPLGVWLSDKPWLCMPMAWITMLFEAFFPVFIWARRVNPWWLLVGFGMHAFIFLTMHVSTFSFIAVAAYPVLLHPEAFAALPRAWQRVRSRLGRR
jgi:hypothetical protein